MRPVKCRNKLLSVTVVQQFGRFPGETRTFADTVCSVTLDPERPTLGASKGCRIASFDGKINQRSFLRQPRLAQAINENC